MRIIFIPVFLLVTLTLFGQNKKPIDHTVYDGWRSVGERIISNDGNYVVYNINVQEGDGELVIQHIKTNYKKIIPRGYGAVITEDSRYAVFKIKPLYQDARQAKIKKKSGDDMPKDSLAIVTLGEDSVIKIIRVKSFKTPLKAAGWLAWQMEKPLPDTSKAKSLPDSVKIKIDMLAKLADSVIRRSLDSVKGNIEKEAVITAAKKAVKEIYKKADDIWQAYQLDADGDNAGAGGGTDGTDLVVRNMTTAAEKTFKLVSEYLFDEKATKLLIRTTRNAKDSNSKSCLLIYNLQADDIDTIMRGLNDAKGFSFDVEGKQLAFVAERDSSSKALQKFYKLWYHVTGQDTATILADKNTIGMQLGSTVSENGSVIFSKDGMKIFFGVAPIQSPKDTTLVDFELAQLDVWHYNDDYLQPQQLKQLSQDQKRNYTSVIKPGATELIQLGADDAENIFLVDEGNASWVLALSTKNNRKGAQWEGRTKTTAYMISTNDGRRKLVEANSPGFFNASPKGKYIYWYNPELKNYFTYNTTTGDTKNIADKIKEPLYDIENDVPDYPGSAGTTGWTANDRYFLVNDVYDIWQTDPNAVEQPKNITNGWAKRNKTKFNYINFDKEKRSINDDEAIVLLSLDKTTKYAGFYHKKVNEISDPVLITNGPYTYSAAPIKAKNAEAYIFRRGNSSESELFAGNDLKNMDKLTDIAVQQKDYNWLTTELVKWKMFDGKMSEGLLFKPENFDPKKKYPIIFYFYERDADGLYNYYTPAPSASTINIPYFVSNEYLVFDPNIYYKTGEPGESAYNSVVSAAKYFSKMPWVDSTRMAIQGQSWGGYQVAYLVTRTNIFRAAGAGAPVSNMTSAYGGIRWGTGLNRQFQYEKQQSRIGATLWQRPDLYLKNSPLFNADKVNTPLLLMHNDADGAVPWYQSIEYFTALRRLGKKVWLLEYNGEDHNLVERKNRKDLSVRLGQFFDHYLKDAKPANWIKYGVPATDKGKDWGLKVE